jgi:hypothetical protein
MAAVFSPSAGSIFDNYLPSNATSDQFLSKLSNATLNPTSKWTTIVLLLISPLLISFLRYLLFKDKPPQGLKLVPGPPSTIPYIGRVDIDPIAPWNSMKRWSDQFNGMFRLTACGEMHIWLGDNKVAQELYCNRAANYSSRPEVAAVPGSDRQGQYLPLLEYGGKLFCCPVRTALDFEPFAYL